MTLTHVDLFSGIGGFALASRWNGIETVQFVEIDPFCCKVLEKNFPGVPIHHDIKTFTNAGCERQKVSEEQTTGIEQRPFLLTGGFPCQPFSCAGKRRGKEDDRYLWPEMLRVVSEAKPTWIIGENVAGFINMGLDDCISDLEDQGYEVQAFVIPACAVNAPHRRDRVWIVANSINSGDRGGRNGNTGRVQCTLQTKRSDCHAADSETEGLEGGNATRSSSSDGRLAEHFDGNGRDNETEPWTTPWLEAATRLCRVDARVSNRVDRLKSLGNAIVPQVASELMRAILEAEGGK